MKAPIALPFGVRLGEPEKLFLVAGPCVIESEDKTLRAAEAIRAIAERTGVPTVFKASYDKANRSSAKSYRGPGMGDGLRILAKVRERIGIPILTDVHESSEVEPVAVVADVLQIPAFLCRQTPLLVAAGESGKPVNVKKGQFLAPWDMRGPVEKIAATGNGRILVTERGASFGYNRLVSDMTAIPILRELGHPVVFDATHSVQQPGGLGDRTGGERRMVPVLALAAVAAGCDGLFLEAHEDPDKSPSDGPNMIRLADLEALLRRALAVKRAIAAPPG